MPAPTEEFINPNTSSSKQQLRGRKRQRIPHTAVERRYRENLNAHLDKLRLTVPAFARRGSGGGGIEIGGAKAGEHGESGGVKPSKCEVLTGAIEHIGALDRENKGLRGEVERLKARVEELEGWPAERRVSR